jgi:hypothetical protein
MKEYGDPAWDDDPGMKKFVAFLGRGSVSCAPLGAFVENRSDEVEAGSRGKQRRDA